MNNWQSSISSINDKRNQHQADALKAKSALLSYLTSQDDSLKAQNITSNSRSNFVELKTDDAELMSISFNVDTKGKCLVSLYFDADKKAGSKSTAFHFDNPNGGASFFEERTAGVIAAYLASRAG